MTQTETPKTYEELLAELRPKPRMFVQHYVKTMNATQSALSAGYSPVSAHSIGSENLRKPEIAAAVEAGLSQVMGANEVRARTAEVAAGTLEDFLNIERVLSPTPVELDADEAIDLLNETIADLSDELDSAPEERAEWIAKEIRRLRRSVRKCERAIERAERDGESRGNPQVTIEVEWKERVHVAFDFEKAKRLGKLHLLKKFEETKYGHKIELYDAAQARELLGKHYRLWGDRLALENPDGSPIKFVVGIPGDAL